MTIGERIKLEREKKGWTQDDLAERCGYKYKTSISKIELSGDRVSNKKLKIVADALGVPVGRLMGWDETYSEAKKRFIDYYAEHNYPADEADLFEELHTRSEMKMLFQTVKGMTREQIEAIVNMAKSFKGGDDNDAR